VSDSLHPLQDNPELLMRSNSLVAAILVAAANRFGEAIPASTLATGYALPSRLDSAGFAYNCDYSTFFIEMSGWNKLPPRS